VPNWYLKSFLFRASRKACSSDEVFLVMRRPALDHGWGEAGRQLYGSPGVDAPAPLSG
jgi:hypothetical protein